MDGDIVCSIWKHIAGVIPGNMVATYSEHKGCEANSILWSTGLKSDQEIVRQRKRRLQYIANILVISDSKNPDNEGKVFLFKFGLKIFEKIMAAIKPEFEDESPFNPFDFWEGANFKLKIRQVEGYRNYDRSEFDEQSALLDGDDVALEGLWKQEYSLKELIAPSQFKSFEELKKKHSTIMGSEESLENAIKKHNNDDDIPFDNSPPFDVDKPKATKQSPKQAIEEDDDLSLYAKLLADD